MRSQTKEKKEENTKRPRRREAQVAVEFILLVGFVMMAFFVFVIFVRENFSDTQTATTGYQIKDIAVSVQTEMNKAATMEDGYSRAFEIPENIDGTEYNITKTGDFLMFSTEDSEYSVTVPSFTGMVVKGNNHIVKKDGSLEVN